MLDIHSHILPGVDHGAADLAESIDMLEAARAMGITCIVATPHVYRSDFDRRAARAAFQSLQPEAKKRGINLRLGYECNFRALEKSDLGKAAAFCMEGTKRLMLEMPSKQWPREWKEIIYELQAHGLEVVIVHPERYEPVQKDLAVLERLAEMDVLFQVDVPQKSMLFSAQGRVLRRLGEMGCMHYAASDAHCARDYEIYAKGRRKLEKWLNPPERT